MADFLVVLTGGLFLVIIPFIPKLLRLRLCFLRWIRWERVAKRLEKHFQGQTWLLRILFFVVGIHFFYLYVSFSWREWLFEVRRLQPWRWRNVDVQRRTFTILRCLCPSYSPCLWLTTQETRRVVGKGILAFDLLILTRFGVVHVRKVRGFSERNERTAFGYLLPFSIFSDILIF